LNLPFVETQEGVDVDVEESNVGPHKEVISHSPNRNNQPNSQRPVSLLLMIEISETGWTSYWKSHARKFSAIDANHVIDDRIKTSRKSVGVESAATGSSVAIKL